MFHLLKTARPYLVVSLFVANSLFSQDEVTNFFQSKKKKSDTSSQSCRPAPAPMPKSECAPPPQKCEPAPMPKSECAPPPQKCEPAPTPKSECAPLPPACKPVPMPKKVCAPCPSVCDPVLNSGYSHPARITTQCPSEMNVDAGFLYWIPYQENMELAVLAKPSAYSPTPLSSRSLPVRGEVINMNFNYNPGFKVSLGIGFDYDDWDVHADYYWMHNKYKKSYFDADFVSGATNAFTGGGLLALWGSPRLLSDGSAFSGFQSTSENWKLHMDIANLDFGRWYYVGRKLTFRPSVGLRGAWIRQNVHVQYNNGSISPQTGINVDIRAKSHSWGVGPKAGLETNWLLGCGFRFYGNGEGDLLYTKYSQLRTRQFDSQSLSSTRPQNVAFIQKEVGTLRTHLDLELGLGWGTYFDCRNWHIDFAAGYEFQVFFDQNMFRKYVDDVTPSFSLSPNGNLYVHGLTATMRFDF